MDIKYVWCKDWRATPKDGDYYDEHGYLRCGVCGLRKECVIDLHRGPRPYLDAPKRFVVRPIYCDCNNPEKPVHETCSDNPNVLLMSYEDFMSKYWHKDVSRKTDVESDQTDHKE